MKCEIDVWENTIKKLFFDYFRWKHCMYTLRDKEILEKKLKKNFIK
jgi:hypothetical protein